MTSINFNCSHEASSAESVRMGRLMIGTLINVGQRMLINRAKFQTKSNRNSWRHRTCSLANSCQSDHQFHTSFALSYNYRVVRTSNCPADRNRSKPGQGTSKRTMGKMKFMVRPLRSAPSQRVVSSRGRHAMAPALRCPDAFDFPFHTANFFPRLLWPPQSLCLAHGPAKPARAFVSILITDELVYLSLPHPRNCTRMTRRMRSRRQLSPRTRPSKTSCPRLLLRPSASSTDRGVARC